jgi:GNAT superfamily N-acetyltransferase
VNNPVRDQLRQQAGDAGDRRGVGPASVGAAPGPGGRYRLRAATAGDAAVLARQRRAMFETMGMLPDGPRAGDELEAVARKWIEREVAAGTFFSWVVELAEAPHAIGASAPLEVVAGGGLQLRPLMPRPGFVRGEPEALVLSMWTEPAHRRQGLATLVMEAMLAWCRARGIRRVTLHASAMGRPIYERLGFKVTNEMRLEPPSDPSGR